MLALVIPVWNDAAGLARLLAQVPAHPLISEVIIVDDASKTPLTPQALGVDLRAFPARIVYARNARQRGAGYARNRGLKKVTAPFVTFFDSDDELLPLLSDLMEDLAPKTFDFCIFKHDDSRVGRGQLATDETFWHNAGVTKPLEPITRQQAAALAGVAAYPWNKIYRTGFLREAQIRCTELVVHNDIELHWTSFLKAQTIYASSRHCARHFVAERARRLTNRRGQERLEVFIALSAVLDAIEEAPERRAYLAPFLRFSLMLFDWIDERLTPDLKARFKARARGFLTGRVSPELMQLTVLKDPSLGRWVNDYLTGVTRW